MIIIMVLAAFLRLYDLGNNPPSLDWDEASLGYNAFSILKTGKDEFGRAWPISIRSFEDYKPAMYTYLTVPAIWIFGLNEYSVRLPSAIMGTLTVLICFFLLKELFSKRVALLATLLLTISPWHLQFSRIAFESNVSLFFVFTGFWFFLKALKKGVWFVPSAFFLVLSFYTYHSPRLVVPFVLLGWTIFYRKQIWQQRKYVFIAFILAIFLLIPFVQEALNVGRARLSSVTVISAQGNLNDSIKKIEYDESVSDLLGKLLHNRRMIYVKAITKGYLDHFNLDFLFFRGDAPDRHHARDMGMLYLWEAPFIAFGLVVLTRWKNAFPIFWWFLMAPLASSITTGTPHAVRALLFLPIYQIFTAIGIIYSFRWMKKFIVFTPVIYLAKISVFILIAINIFYYFQMYYVHTPNEASKDWQYGYKQAVEVAKNFEDQVDKIVMTYKYDQPHIFVLFFNQVDPVWYQSLWQGGEVLREQRSFGKYTFRLIKWEEDKNATNTLFIGTSDEIPDGQEGHIVDIPFLDHKIAFRIVKR